MNPTRKGYTPPGTKHDRTVRKSPCGHPVPLDHPRAASWDELVVPGPRPTGVRRPFIVDVPPRSNVLTESKDVPAAVPGQASRRDRRPALVAAAKAARRAQNRPQPTGGGYCPCSGVTDFYSDSDREQWDDRHASCDESVSA